MQPNTILFPSIQQKIINENESLQPNFLIIEYHEPYL